MIVLYCIAHKLLFTSLLTSSLNEELAMSAEELVLTCFTKKSIFFYFPWAIQEGLVDSILQLSQKNRFEISRFTKRIYSV